MCLSYTNQKNIDVIFILHSVPKSGTLKVEVYDKDNAPKLYDDFLGRIHVSLDDLVVNEKSVSWYTLQDIKTGQIHLKLKYVS